MCFLRGNSFFLLYEYVAEDGELKEARQEIILFNRIESHLFKSIKVNLGLLWDASKVEDATDGNTRIKLYTIIIFSPVKLSFPLSVRYNIRLFVQNSNVYF